MSQSVQFRGVHGSVVKGVRTVVHHYICAYQLSFVLRYAWTAELGGWFLLAANGQGLMQVMVLFVYVEQTFLGRCLVDRVSLLSLLRT